MKSKWLLAVIALAGATAGCVLTSGQFLVDFDLGDIHVSSPTNLVARDVDLNTIDDYNDHKDDLKGLADIAILGTFTNNGSNAIDVEVWMTPNQTSYTTESEVEANGVKLWGPFHLAANETKKVDWDTSAGLFDLQGKVTLLGEVKGDGEFTVYAIGVAGTYDFTVTDGVVVLVLDAGV